MITNQKMKVEDIIGEIMVRNKIEKNRKYLL